MENIREIEKWADEKGWLLARQCALLMQDRNPGTELQRAFDRLYWALHKGELKSIKVVGTWHHLIRADDFFSWMK